MKTSSKYLDPSGHRLPIDFFCLLLKSNQITLKMACNIALHFREHSAKVMILSASDFYPETGKILGVIR